ncbi:MAG TPA: hypothetical protein VJ978_14275 [Nitriliruptoraceae bacterium]|nr:hypothetical protein [Nitriliruptoraceae bacterium]
MRTGLQFVVAASLVLAATACAPAGDDGEVATPEEAIEERSTRDAPTAPRTSLPATGSSPTTGESDGTPTDVDVTPNATPGTSSDAGRTLTGMDDGTSVALQVGEQVSLLQADPTSPDPTVTGDSIELVEMVNVTASGRREWEVRAVAEGRSDLVVPDGDTTFELFVEVR